MDISKIILATLALSFFLAYVITYKKLQAMSKGFTHLFLAYNNIAESNQQTDQDIHKDNFIKFLSDSREWAFDYIENVQDGLKAFIVEVEPTINHFDDYGVVIEGMPLYKDMEKISAEFKKLKSLLPEEAND